MGQKKIWVFKKNCPKKKFGRKKFLPKKNLGQKKFGSKKNLVQKNLGRHFFLHESSSWVKIGLHAENQLPWIWDWKDFEERQNVS